MKKKKDKMKRKMEARKGTYDKKFKREREEEGAKV